MTTRRCLILEGPGRVTWRQERVSALGLHDVLIRSTFSSLKHGTELMAFRGHGPFEQLKFDLELRLFKPAPPKTGLHSRPVGNMTVGVVEAVGDQASRFQVGQSIYGWLPVADYHVVPCERLEPLGNLSAEEAVCIDPAVFALGAMYDADIRPGERVAVFGLGAIGLLLIQCLMQLGARVLGVEHFENRLQVARDYGLAEWVRAREASDPGYEIKTRWPPGVDAAIECSGNVRWLHQAIRATRQCGRVATVGFYADDAAGLRLGEEYFHNRITLLASLPALRWGNPTRGEDPRDYARLKAEAIDRFRTRQLHADRLIEPIIPFTEAEGILPFISSSPDRTIKVGISY